ncbi:hypothetical protein JB92DRAFT_2909896 [Gautieria morchelliformis]|nr:hypothetical protein JB92DRAFT_2909896 [Gautieria morchelliformis]
MSQLDATLGALEIGSIFSLILYGAATVQVINYAQANFKDHWVLRSLVAFVWTLETVHSVLTIHLLYSLTVTNYGNPASLLQASWSIDLQPTFTSFVTASVQSFFGYRVWVLSGRLIIPVICWIGVFLRCLGGVAVGVTSMQSKTLPHFVAQFQWLVTSTIVVAASTDVLTTASLCYYLLHRRSGFEATDRLITKIVFWSVETGLITCICAITIVACCLTMPSNFIWIGLLMFYAKFFSNTLMASLNARNFHKPKASVAFDSTGHHFSGVRFQGSQTLQPEVSQGNVALRLKPMGPDALHFEDSFDLKQRVTASTPV